MTMSPPNQAIRLRPDRREAPPDSERIVFYEGDRIYFRPIESGDEALLRQYMNNPANWRTLGHRGPINTQREREWIDSLGKTPGAYIFGIVTRDDDRLIGTVGLHGVDPVSRKAVLGICIGDVAAQNRGHGTEATRLVVRYGFEELNLNRIELEVLASNPRAIMAYQRAGFVHEGCLRQAVYRGGEYVDLYVFSILREEYEASLRFVESA